MPVIRSYQNQVGTLGPVQERQRTAEDFGAGIGRGVQAMAGALSQAGDYLYKRAEQKELSDLNARLAKIQAENSGDFQQTLKTADPNDKEVFNSFNERAKERFEAAQEDLETIGGRNYYNQASSKMQAQLTFNTAKAQADLVAEKAVQDYEEVVTNLSAAVVSDPSGLDLNLQLHAQSVDNLVQSGQIPKLKGEELKRESERVLVTSALRGWMQLDPGYAKEQVASGRFDSKLGGELKVQMFAEADRALRAKDVEIERQRRQREELVAEQQRLTQDKFFEMAVNGELSTDEILNSNLEPFGTGSKQQFVNMISKSNQQGPPKTNPRIFNDVFDRIYLPDGDPQKITSESQINELVGDGLSLSDAIKLRAEITGTKTENGRIEGQLKKQMFKVADAALTNRNPITGVADPDGEESYLTFQYLAFEKIKEYRQAGKPVVDLLNPTSPDYLGKIIPQFKKSPQEILKSQMKSLQTQRHETLKDSLEGRVPAPKVEPRKADESAAQYLERLKKQAGK